MADEAAMMGTAFVHTVIDDHSRVAYAEIHDDVAPMLCGGILASRSLQLAGVPPGGVLGLYGFGTAGNLTLQMAVASP